MENAPDSQQPTGEIGNIGTISGSHNPVVVGSSDVHIHFHSDGSGGSQPPRHSPRTDQERELGASSYQEVGNNTWDKLKEVYKSTESYVQLLPQVHGDKKPIFDVYTKVQLETREGVAFPTGKGESANSTEYVKIFGLTTKNEYSIKRFIFVGEGGVGKSTIFGKIAYDWADGTSKILNRFKLVFRLKMCALDQKSNLMDSVFDQLLGEQSGVQKTELERFILDNANDVLILLDGFDEMRTKTLDPASFGSILKALNLNKRKYAKCFICVSTRPSHLETLISDELVQNPCIHVQVFGFSDDDVKVYVRKFFGEDSNRADALIQTIGDSDTLRTFATKPMLLVFMCCLWRESKTLPKTTSRLFKEAVGHMFARKRDISDEDPLKVMISIGLTALRGLMSENQKLSFQADEFEPSALDLALKAGILTKRRVFKNRKPHSNIRFMNKQMQAYCAAIYVHSLNDPTLLIRRFYCKWEYRRLLSQMCSTIQDVDKNKYLFRFLCDDNENCMMDILKLLESRFGKSGPLHVKTAFF